MTRKTWQTIKMCYCHHVGKDVAWKPRSFTRRMCCRTQPPRVLAHRCSMPVLQPGRARQLPVGRHEPGLIDPISAGIL